MLVRNKPIIHDLYQQDESLKRAKTLDEEVVNKIRGLRNPTVRLGTCRKRWRTEIVITI